MRLVTVTFVGLFASACSSTDAGPAPVADAGVDVAVDAGPATADWVVSLDGTAAARKVSPALLGHYDLSGALYRYDQKAGLASALLPAGVRDWRVGVGRWEAVTQLLPTLTDNTPCTSAFAEAFAPNGTTDLDLIKARDWFTDNGSVVTANDLQDDTRYALAYVRKTIDVAHALGATPYLGIDHMPRAFAANKTPSRTKAAWPDACNWTWTNAVSNVAPADAYLTQPMFAAAVAGMVRRVVEGSGGEPGRDAPYWEFWNEPELAYAWNPAYDDAKSSKFYTTALQTMVLLDQYRTTSSAPAAKKLRFGLASFAYADTAVGVMSVLDQAQTQVPVDFFSFHAYSNDPLAIVAQIAKVTAARQTSKRYASAELALTEWGPALDASLDPKTMEMPLLVATVIARGASLGLDRAYHTFFYDYFAGLPWGLVDNALAQTPLFHAYELLSGLIGDGGDRLLVAGSPDGALGGTDGAVMAVRDSKGATRVLLVNRGAAPKTLRVDLGGAPATPARVRVFDDPTRAVRDVAPSPVVTLPPTSITLVTL